MDKEAKERTLIQKVLDTLPPGHTIIKDAHRILMEQGHEIKLKSLYEVVKGRNNKQDYVDAILTAAERFKARREELEARARSLTEA